MKKLTPQTRRVLDTMNIDAAMKDVTVLGFRPQSREIAEAGMHKARIMAGRAFTRWQREQSREWLRTHNFKIPGQSR